MTYYMALCFFQSLELEVNSHKEDIEILSPLSQELHNVGVIAPIIDTNTENINTEYQELCHRLKVKRNIHIVI